MSLFKLRLLFPRYVRFIGSEPVPQRLGITPFRIKQQEYLMINQVLEENKEIDNEKWAQIRKELMESKLPVNEHNIDSVIVDRCHYSKHGTAAINYIKYLIATGQNLNVAIIGKYFKALYHAKNPLEEEETNIILKLYDDLRAKYSILDFKTAENCILALSLTKRWREYDDLFKISDCTVETSSIANNAIASAAFNNDDPNAGWKFMQSMLAKSSLSYKLFQSYLNYSIRNSKDTKELEHHFDKMFEFWSDYDYYPSLASIQIYGDYLGNTGEWSVRKTTINAKGTCSTCGQTLAACQITHEDFDSLRDTFFSKVVVGSDLYCNTTPEELKRFQRFVQSTKPYDVVIDGLNAAYLSRVKGKANRAEQLAKVVEIFVQRNEKVFVLGRKHMHSWSSSAMDYVKKNAYIFFANDLSEDDQFLLNAALSSGIKTQLVSADFMRQHKFSLANDRIRRVFRHWQLSRQIVPVYVGGAQNKQLLLVYPANVLPIAQMTPDRDWHIPYNEGEPEKELQPQHKPKKWLCLRKKKNSH